MISSCYSAFLKARFLNCKCMKQLYRNIVMCFIFPNNLEIKLFTLLSQNILDFIKYN